MRNRLIVLFCITLVVAGGAWYWHASSHAVKPMASPVMAKGCGSHTDKAEVVCEEDYIECQEINSGSTFN